MPHFHVHTLLTRALYMRLYLLWAVGKDLPAAGAVEMRVGWSIRGNRGQLIAIAARDVDGAGLNRLQVGGLHNQLCAQPRSGTVQSDARVVVVVCVL